MTAEKRGPMSLFQPIRAHLTGALFAGAALVGVTGCTATVTARPRTAVLYSHPVVYVDDAPDGIYESPTAYYRGQPAYLVDDRWYYRSDDAWVYFSDEPSELRRARTSRTFVHVDAP